MSKAKKYDIAKNDILEVIGKAKPFALLKELINNKKDIFLTSYTIITK